ncbi:hypothetical protein JYU34_003040 [Plutella xylostella]|uniref:Uncharacterized protein n=1 Tax=Plutella xylostella TaxID=51655 RepID=A0ABQ7QZ29_PLUXY|nr:hypothetical protein JYU34_003040 [Plutella xylostella]
MRISSSLPLAPSATLSKALGSPLQKPAIRPRLRAAPAAILETHAQEVLSFFSTLRKSPAPRRPRPPPPSSATHTH